MVCPLLQQYKTLSVKTRYARPYFLFPFRHAAMNYLSGCKIVSARPISSQNLFGWRPGALLLEGSVLVLTILYRAFFESAGPLHFSASYLSGDAIGRQFVGLCSIHLLRWLVFRFRIFVLPLRQLVVRWLPHFGRFLVVFGRLSLSPAEQEKETDTEKRKYDDGHSDTNANLGPC